MLPYCLTSSLMQFETYTILLRFFMDIFRNDKYNINSIIKIISDILVLSMICNGICYFFLFFLKIMDDMRINIASY